MKKQIGSEKTKETQTMQEREEGKEADRNE